MHDAADDGDARDAGAGEVGCVVSSDVADSDDGQLRGGDDGGIALEPQRWAAGVLCGGGTERTAADVVEDVRVLVGILDEGQGAGGEPDEGVGAEERAGRADGEIVLTQVDTGDGKARLAQGEGDVDAVVDDDGGVWIRGVDGGGYRRTQVIEIARRNGLRTYLDDPGPT